MVAKALQGSEGVMKALRDIAERMGGGSVEVGFMDAATYPDGTPVAAVAFWNEFGTSDIPPRPFFRGMIARESTTWPGKMAALAKSSGNAEQVLGALGADIKGALQQSINDMSTPANAQSTEDAKGFNKPLIDTGVMINSITFKVNK